MLLARRVGFVLATIASIIGVLTAGLAAAPTASGNRIGSVERLLGSDVDARGGSLGSESAEPDPTDATAASVATGSGAETDEDGAIPVGPAPRKARPETITVTTDEDESADGTNTAATAERGNEPSSTPAIDQTPGGCDEASNGPIASRLNEHEATVVGLYCALLGRTPDTEGLEYWSDLLADGLDAGALAAELEASPEYLQRNELAVGTTVPGASTTEPPVAPTSTSSVISTTVAPARATTTVIAGPPPSAAGPDTLRSRTPVAQDRFAAWAENRGFDDRTWVTDSLVHGWWIGDGRRIHVALVHLSGSDGIRVSPGGRSRSTVGTWASEIGAQVAVNGNWYAPWDGPAVSGGQVYGGDDHFYTSLFGFTAELDTIVEHHRAVNDGVDGRITEGVSGHPTLVHRGAETTDFGGDPTFTNRHPRTAIGVDSTGDVLILVTVDGRSSSALGMTGGETASLMKAIGAHDAVMLDGGGSTTMWIQGKGVVNRPSGGLRAVGNQIAVFG